MPRSSKKSIANPLETFGNAFMILLVPTVTQRLSLHKKNSLFHDVGQNASRTHEILGEHAVIGTLNMFGSCHLYIEMKKAAIVKLLETHIKDASIYYVVSNTNHKYDLCVAIP